MADGGPGDADGDPGRGHASGRRSHHGRTTDGSRARRGGARRRRCARSTAAASRDGRRVQAGWRGQVHPDGSRRGASRRPCLRGSRAAGHRGCDRASRPLVRSAPALGPHGGGCLSPAVRALVLGRPVGRPCTLGVLCGADGSRCLGLGAVDPGGLRLGGTGPDRRRGRGQRIAVDRVAAATSRVAGHRPGPARGRRGRQDCVGRGGSGRSERRRGRQLLRSASGRRRRLHALRDPARLERRRRAGDPPAKRRSGRQRRRDLRRREGRSRRGERAHRDGPTHARVLRWP